MGDGFITLSVRRLMDGHAYSEIPLHRAIPVKDWKPRTPDDRVLIGGTNIVGVTGTVRCSHSLAWFRQLNCPIVALGIGAQAGLDGKIVIDRRGRALLEFWYRSAGPLSVRDRFTQETLERLLGPGSATLTGCPTLFLRWPRREKMNGPLFVPGPYRNFLWPGTQRGYARLSSQLGRRILSRAGTMLAQQADGLRVGKPCLFFPEGPAPHLDAIVRASSVLSFRIHPLLVGLVNDVPGLLIALDGRTKSMAQTVGLPFIEYRDGLTEEEVLSVWQDTLDRYPWSEVREKISALRSAMVGHLKSQGLEIHDASLPTGSHLVHGLGISDRVPNQGMLALVALLKATPFGSSLIRLQQLKASIVGT